MEVGREEEEVIRMRMRFAWSDPAVLRSVVCLVMVLIVALVPVGCGSDGDDDVAVASDLIDQWVAGWNDNDADAIAAVFTEDGTFINEGDLQNRWTGRQITHPGLFERLDGVVHLAHGSGQ